MSSARLSAWLRRVLFASLLLGAAPLWAAISYVSSAVDVSSSSTTNNVTIPAPTGLSAGDVMVAILTQRKDSKPLIQTAPAGWNLVLARDDGSSIGIAVYLKVAGSTEPASYFWQFKDTDRSGGAITAFRGVDASSPVLTSQSQANANSTSMTAPSVTPTVADTMLLALYAGRNGNFDATPPAGMTEALDAGNGAGPNGVMLTAAYAVQAGTGASGAKVATASSAMISIGALLALRPGASTGPDHYELSLSTSSLACLPTAVTVTACANASSPCTSPATTLSGATAVLSTSGATLGSTSVSFNAGGVASTTLSYPTAGNGTAVSVTLSGESAAATNARQCCPNGSSCAVANSCGTTFNSAGLIVAGSAGGNAATVPTQTAGTASAGLVLRAVKTGTTTQACESALSGSQTVNWAYECNDPAACSSGNLMGVTGSPTAPAQRNNNGAPLAYLPVTMNFDANGNAPFSFNFADVGRVTLWASASANGATLTGGSNAFVVRPAGFTLGGIQQSASPNLANPAAASAAGARFVKAGESFSVSVTAVTSGGAATPNFGKESAAEGVLLTPTLVQPGGGVSGALGNGSLAGGSFVGGVSTATNLSYSEVGIITLTPSVADGSYLGVGAVGGPASVNIGRFIPASFALTLPTVSHRSALGCAPASPFSYLDENFRLGFTLTAQSLAGTTTQNYAGSFAKLDPSVAGGWNLAGVDGSTVFTGGGRLALGSASGSWSAGVAAVTLTANARRAAAPDGPFSANFGVAPVDADGVALPAFDMASVPAGANDRKSIGMVALRFGRLRLSNAIGAADRDLSLPVTVQYWTGSVFDTNALDSCSTVPASAVSFGNLRRTLTTADTTVSSPIAVSGGVGALKLIKPVSGRSGTVDVALSLGSAALDASCLQPWTPGSGDAASAGANLGFLRGAWCGAAYDKDPAARASFGLPRGQDGWVYRRENY